MSAPAHFRDQERLTEERERQAVRRREDLCWVMEGPRGRRIVMDWIEDSGAHGDVFHPVAMEMARNAGAARRGRYLEELVKKHCFPDYLKMLQEAQEEKERERDAGSRTTPN